MDGTRTVVRVVGWTVLVILVSPDLGHAYVDPTAGGFLLQLIFGGTTSLALLGRIFARRLSERILRRLRGPK